MPVLTAAFCEGILGRGMMSENTEERFKGLIKRRGKGTRPGVGNLSLSVGMKE